jgi:protein O-mannosyl-transferase
VARSKRKQAGRAKSDSEQPSAVPNNPLKPFSALQSLSPARTLLLISLFSFLAYANSLGGAFVFDDTDQIVENQNIRSWDNLATAFTTHVWAFREQSGALNVPPPLPYYRPLFTVMLTVEYHLFGLWPQGWHLVSLLLHLLCAAGVFYVILRMSGRNLLALFAAIVFAVHPVHTESVSWISGMTDPLFGVFFLASFYLYLKARVPADRGPRTQGMFVFSLVIFVFAAFAKETALSLVVLVFGYEMIESSGKKAERFITATKRALLYAAAALVYLVPRYLVLGELMWRNPQAPDRPLTYTLLTLPFVICSYVAHLLWPVGLSVTYNTHFVTSVTSPDFLLPAAAIGLVLAVLLFYRKRISREVWQALLLVFVPLLPVLKLGQVSQEEYLVFDHYLYLSVAGLGYLVALGVCKLGGFESTERQTRIAGLGRPAFATGAFLVMTVALMVSAGMENRSWIDSYSLWCNVARVRPGYWAAHYNAGLALLDTKRFDEAQASLDRAIALRPDDSNVLAALGRSYDGKGEISSAVASFKKAIEISPEMFEAYNDLGTVYFKNGEYALAEANFAAALRLKPEATASRFNLGLCYSRIGRYSDATRELERVVQATPLDAEALYELGLAYERISRLDDALRAFERGQGRARSQELANKIAESLALIRHQ